MQKTSALKITILRAKNGFITIKNIPKIANFYGNGMVYIYHKNAAMVHNYSRY